MFEFVGISLLCIVVLIAFMIWWRNRQLTALARRGIGITGRVVRKTHREDPEDSKEDGFRIDFEYTAPNGQRFARYYDTTIDEFDLWEEGSAFELVYLPDKPGVCAARGLVEAKREAIRNRGMPRG